MKQPPGFGFAIRVFYCGEHGCGKAIEFEDPWLGDEAPEVGEIEMRMLECDVCKKSFPATNVRIYFEDGISERELVKEYDLKEFGTGEAATN